MGAQNKINTAYNFGFNIPDDALVTGAVATVKTSTNNAQNLSIQLASDASTGTPTTLGSAIVDAVPVNGSDCASTINADWGTDIVTDWGIATPAVDIPPAVVNTTQFGLVFTTVDNSSLKVDAVCLEIQYTTALGEGIQQDCETFPFVVEKTYADGADIPASIELTCNVGTVLNSPQDASPSDAAVFFVDDPSFAALCTATEPNPPEGYTPDVSNCVDIGLLDPGTCTIDNTTVGTFTVNKVYVGIPGPEVEVMLTCDAGVSIDSTNPAMTSGGTVEFDVSGFDGLDTCTAVETSVPAGYSGDASDCSNVSIADDGECDITNTTTGTFTVNKTYVGGPGPEVEVTLACDPGVSIDSTNPATTVGGTVSFDVSAFDDSDTCTATESVPTGYSGNEVDCDAVDIDDDGVCGITNTRVDTFTVTKRYLGDPGGEVEVQLTCGGNGSIQTNPLMTTSGTAVFDMSGFLDTDTCTATETSVPMGYTQDDSDCQDGADLANGGSCIITNTSAGTFTVNKQYVGEPGGEVDITLSCDAGVSIDSTNPATTSGGTASFDVSGFDAQDTCTATEDVPTGYSENEADCSGVNIVEDGDCTITNTREAQFTVTKDYVGEPGGEVEVMLTCTGDGSIDSNPLMTSSGTASFDLSGYLDSDTCTAVETSVPTGYSEDETDCQDNDMANGGSCTITNTRVDTFTVRKDYEGEPGPEVEVMLTCSDAGGEGSIDINPLTTSGGSASFDMSGYLDTDTCTAVETSVPSGYSEDESDCTDGSDLANGGSCVIVNRRDAQFTVTKSYVGETGPEVNVQLSCDGDGSIDSTNPADTSGLSVTFDVSGYLDSDTCTAVETTVPMGYSEDESDCQDNQDSANGGSCEIVNTRTTTYTVRKDFTDDNDQLMVEVTLNCGGNGTIENPNPAMAGENNSAEFTVNGFTEPLTCTATEAVPDDYLGDDSDCADMVDGVKNACVIVNEPEMPELTIVKSGSGPDSDYDSVGDPLIYEFTVTNTGNVPIDFPITIDDNVTENESCPAVDSSGDNNNVLDVGENVICSASYNVDQGDLDAGSVDNCATASGSFEANPVQSAEDCESLDAEQNPAISLDKSANPTEYSQVGDVITYTFVVDNTGNVTLYDIDVSDPLINDPPNSQPITCPGGNPIPSLAPADPPVNCTGQYTITQQDLDNGTVENTATATGCTVSSGGGRGTTDCQGVTAQDDDDVIIERVFLAATFHVTKDFDDDNTAGVPIYIECTTGLPMMSDATVYEFHAIFDEIAFIVQDHDPGELDCHIYEDVPDGYEPSYEAYYGQDAVAGVDPYSDGEGCYFEEVEGGHFHCDITNTLQKIDVVVDKIWIDDQAAENGEFLFAGAKWHCDPVADRNDVPWWQEPRFGHLTFHGELSGYREAGDPARLWDYDTFMFYPHFNGSICSVDELELDSNVFTDDSDCQDLEIFPGHEAGEPDCLIINTRIYAGIPTLSEYGLALLALLMLGVGFVAYRRFA